MVLPNQTGLVGDAIVFLPRVRFQLFGEHLMHERDSKSILRPQLTRRA